LIWGINPPKQVGFCVLDARSNTSIHIIIHYINLIYFSITLVNTIFYIQKSEGEIHLSSCRVKKTLEHLKTLPFSLFNIEIKKRKLFDNQFEFRDIGWFLTLYTVNSIDLNCVTLGQICSSPYPNK